MALAVAAPTAKAGEVAFDEHVAHFFGGSMQFFQNLAAMSTSLRYEGEKAVEALDIVTHQRVEVTRVLRVAAASVGMLQGLEQNALQVIEGYLCTGSAWTRRPAMLRRCTEVFVESLMVLKESLAECHSCLQGMGQAAHYDLHGYMKLWDSLADSALIAQKEKVGEMVCEYAHQIDIQVQMYKMLEARLQKLTLAINWLTRFLSVTSDAEVVEVFEVACVRLFDIAAQMSCDQGKLQDARVMVENDMRRIGYSVEYAGRHVLLDQPSFPCSSTPPATAVLTRGQRKRAIGFKTSNFIRLYDSMKGKHCTSEAQVKAVVHKLLVGRAGARGVAPQDIAGFVDQVEQNIRGKVQREGWGRSAAEVAALWWTTMDVLQSDHAFHWYVNDALRADEGNDTGRQLAVFVRTLNSMLVQRGVTEPKWPKEAGRPVLKAFRGCGIPREHWPFFQAGKRYRVPFYLASSLSERKAQEFAVLSTYASVLLEILFAPPSDEPAGLPCLHVALLDKSMVGGELEFLFVPYSVFEVVGRRVCTNSFLGTHLRVTIRAKEDNAHLDSEALPLAGWH